MAAERLDAWRVAQIEAEDLEARLPVREIGLARKPPRRGARKPGGDDGMGAAAQQLERGLVADLHPATGDDGDASPQVGELRPLAEVQVRALRTKLIVEVVDQRVRPLADVAMLRLGRFARWDLRLALRKHVVRNETGRRKYVRRVHGGLAP